MTTVSKKPVLTAISQQSQTIANTKPSTGLKDFIAFGSKTAEVVADYFTAQLNGSKATTKLQDTLYADGYRAFHFDRSNKDAEAKKFHSYVCDIFISRMDEDAQALLKKPKEGLNNTLQALQQSHKNFISTQFGNLYKAMQNLENKKNVSGKADKITDDNVLALRDLQSAIKRLQDASKPCKNAVNIIAELRKVELLFKADGITVPKK
jgi:hypothetical protein